MDPENSNLTATTSESGDALDTSVEDVDVRYGWEIAPDSPLVRLGLVDPKTGKAVEVASEPASTDAAQAAQTGTPHDPKWDSEDNPYKRENADLKAKLGPADPAHDARQTYQSKFDVLQTQAAEAYNALVTGQLTGQPIPPSQAKAYIGQAFQQAKAELDREVERAMLMPMARRMSAEKIAEEYSLPHAAITAKDLEGEPTIEAMKARAKTLQEMRRDTNFTQRVEQQVDRAEGGAPAGPALSEAIEKLSPQNKIALGLARGL